MGLYTQWKRVTGGFGRPDLTAVAKKLLDYLDNQRRLSGVKTMSIKATLPDGSVVTASFYGDHPQVDIQPAGAVVEGKLPSIAGFVLSPTATTIDPHAPIWPDVGTNPEVLALVTGKTATRYSAGGFSKYKHWFPNGIRQAGNIDWRDAKEQWILTFYGPRNRYFENDWGPSTFKSGDPGQGGFKPWIIRNGYTVLDISSAAFLALVPALSGGYIVGAGICSGKLVFVARNNAETMEYAYAVGLSNANPTTAKVFAKLAELVLLATRTMLAGENTGEASHPWLFSQNGLEARCIRQKVDGSGVGTFYEGVLSIAPGVTSAAFSINLLGPEPTTTTTRTVAASTGTYTPYMVWNGVAGPLTGLVPFGYNGTAVDSSTVVAIVDNALTKIAVDYIANLPVYAYARAATRTETSTQNTTESFAQTSTSVTSSRSGTNTYSVSGNGIGIKTDFADITTPYSGSASGTYSGSIALSAPAGYLYNAGSMVQPGTSGPVTRNEALQSIDSEHSVSVTYMDLRQQWLVYELVRVIRTTNTSTAFSTTLPGDGTGFVPIPVTTTVSGPITTRTVVQKGAAILFDETLTYNPTTVSTTNQPMFLTPGNYAGGNLIDPGTGNHLVDMWSFNTYDGEYGGGLAAWNPVSASSNTSTTVPSRLTDWFIDTLSSTSLNSGLRSQRVDQNVFRLSGSWQEYQDHWAFSMGLPRGNGYRTTTAVPDEADRWANGIKGGDLPTLVTGKSEKWVAGMNTGIVPPPFDLFFPISVLPVTVPLA